VALDQTQGLATVDAGLGYRLAWSVGPASGLLVTAGAEVLRGIVASARVGDLFVATYDHTTEGRLCPRSDRFDRLVSQRSGASSNDGRTPSWKPPASGP